MAVDAVAVVRPQFDTKTIARGLARATKHEGKSYNFDFFSSDRLVCTEVVYRAYDGLDGIRFPLVGRKGRPTLSAEDILELALEGEVFAAIAVFGVAPRPAELLVGAEAKTALSASYSSA